MKVNQKYIEGKSFAGHIYYLQNHLQMLRQNVQFLHAAMVNQSSISYQSFLSSEFE